jgi:DNA-binding NarL/FixJ family response regulator
MITCITTDHINLSREGVADLFRNMSEEIRWSAVQSQEELQDVLRNNAKVVLLLSDKPPQTQPLKEDLTVMEKAILHEMALSKTTKEIAWDKHLSFHTVNTHRRNIFRKLGINNMHEAIKYALQSGIIDTTEYYI